MAFFALMLYPIFVYSSTWNKTELWGVFFRSCCLTRLSFHFVFVGLDAIKSYFKKYDNVRPKGFTCFRREDKTKRKKEKKPN